MSLHFARGDFGRAICIVTMAGMDTDCNAATAGSIMGIAKGARGIPASWSAPLNDTFRSQLVNLHEVRISAVAQRTFQIARQNVRRT
jgi:ADP-ribosylglycohydrolase